MKIRDFNWSVDVFLPGVLFIVAIWGLSAGDWEMTVPVGLAVLFQVGWTLRRLYRADGRPVTPLNRVGSGSMVVVAWVLSLTLLLAGLALAGVSPAVMALAALGFAVAGLLLRAIYRRTKPRPRTVV